MRARSVLFLAAMAASAALVVVAASVPAVRDALAVVVAVGLVVAFLGVRIIAYRLGGPDDVFDFWGGMNETTDQLTARYRRPGANPILPPEGQARLPDVAPSFEGHPVGGGRVNPRRGG